MTAHYAHSLLDRDPSHWEPLEDHLRNVAQLAEEFAMPFGAGAWGKLAGQWHDVGKYSSAFQAYLQKENGIEAHLEQYKGRVD